MKNAFYSTVKALFVLKIIFFLPWLFWPCRKNDLIRKVSLVSKFVTLATGKQIILIHIFPDISRYIGNQTMKFGQLMEYNVTNIFLQKSCRK